MIAKQDQTMAVLDDESKNKIMDSITDSVALEKDSADMTCSNSEIDLDSSSFEVEEKMAERTTSAEKCCVENVTKTKIALSFSVDRLLNCENPASANKSKFKIKSPYSVDSKRKCCESVYSCCTYSSCLVGAQHDIHRQQFHLGTMQGAPSSCHLPGSLQQCGPYPDIKSVVRPTPIRALGNGCDQGKNYNLNRVDYLNKKFKCPNVQTSIKRLILCLKWTVQNIHNTRLNNVNIIRITCSLH